MSNLDRYTNGDLSDSVLEQVSGRLIAAKLNRDKRVEWERKLKSDYGIERQDSTSPLFKKKTVWKAVFLAASLGLCLSAFLLLSDTEKPYQKATNAHIAQLDIMTNQALFRKGAQEVETKRLEANLAYSAAAYQKSILLWEELATAGQANAMDYFYLGLCYLQDSPSSPEQCIDRLLESRKLDESSELNAEISWVLALAYLKAGKTEEGSQELSKLIEKNAYKVQEAKELLENL